MNVKHVLKIQWEHILRYIYIKNWGRISDKTRVYLFESRDGASFTDSPRYIFNELMARTDQTQSVFIWIYSRHSDLNNLKTTLPLIDDRVMFVMRDTIEYARALAKSNYLINNSTFPFWFIKHKNQKYINTWHGTPLKLMGFDLPDPRLNKNVLRNFLMADAIISPNQHMTNVLNYSYKLSNVYKGVISEIGLPRLDFTAGFETILSKQFNRSGLQFDKNKKTILYSPTYRGSDPDKSKDDIDKLVKDFEEMVGELQNEYNLLLKVHPFIYRQVQENISKVHLVPDYVDINDLLNITDVLITDYSSVFFDFIHTGNLILFYVWDESDYKSERGLYFESTELPGRIVTNIDCLITTIKDNKTEVIESSLMNSMIVHDDGFASRRAVDLMSSLSNSYVENVSAQKKVLIVIGRKKLSWNEGEKIKKISEVADVTILADDSIEVQDELKGYRILFVFGQPVKTSFEQLTGSLEGENREYQRILGMVDWDKIIVLDNQFASRLAFKKLGINFSSEF